MGVGVLSSSRSSLCVPSPLFWNLLPAWISVSVYSSEVYVAGIKPAAAIQLKSNKCLKSLRFLFLSTRNCLLLHIRQYGREVGLLVSHWVRFESGEIMAIPREQGSPRRLWVAPHGNNAPSKRWSLLEGSRPSVPLPPVDAPGPR